MALLSLLLPVFLTRFNEKIYRSTSLFPGFPEPGAYTYNLIAGRQDAGLHKQ